MQSIELCERSLEKKISIICFHLAHLMKKLRKNKSKPVEANKILFPWQSNLRMIMRHLLSEYLNLDSVPHQSTQDQQLRLPSILSTISTLRTGRRESTLRRNSNRSSSPKLRQRSNKSSFSSSIKKFKTPSEEFLNTKNGNAQNAQKKEWRKSKRRCRNRGRRRNSRIRGFLEKHASLTGCVVLWQNYRIRSSKRLMQDDRQELRRRED